MLLRPAYQKDLQDWTDQELMAALGRTGRTTYFDVIYDRYVHLVYGVCLSLVKEQPAAKDMCMETFSRAYQSLQRDEVQDLPNWLHSIANNVWISRFRIEDKELKIRADQKKFEKSGSNFMEFPAFLRLLNEDKETNYQILEEELARLPDEQRICIQQFYYERKSYKEIASLQGKAENWVKSQLQNGRRRLRIELSQRLDKTHKEQ